MKKILLLLISASWLSCQKPPIKETKKAVVESEEPVISQPTNKPIEQPDPVSVLPSDQPAAILAKVLDRTPPPALKEPAALMNDGWALVSTELPIPSGRAIKNTVIATAEKDIGGKTREISVVHGDLLNEPVEAIVNAANSQLTGGGGIDGIIHDAALVNNQDLMRDEAISYKKLHNIASFPTGSAMVMNSYGLKQFKLVVFTVGPSGASNPVSDKQLYSAIYNSLLKANEYGIKSIATVAVSTGIFGFPKDVAAKLYFKAALQFFADHPSTSIAKVRFTNFDEATAEVVYEGFRKTFE